WAGIVAAFQNLVQDIKDKWAVVKDEINRFFNEHPLGIFLKTVWEGVVEWGAGIWAGIKEWWNTRVKDWWDTFLKEHPLIATLFGGWAAVKFAPLAISTIARALMLAFAGLKALGTFLWKGGKLLFR